MPLHITMEEVPSRGCSWFDSNGRMVHVNPYRDNGFESREIWKVNSTWVECSLLRMQTVKGWGSVPLLSANLDMRNL
ncbi:hypothetical protein Acj9p148 [Acinetobacter phage Acj9]|uniref:Uncharacterized protein n=1 Tax=Acinetobacter phage Acj9 TaxID=760939 RepID=E5EPT2_9CAUD|nr:hypothetical protein Acj9p148 [Acinetobacter phage Acj9]ADG60048.1 hypothetical protein Acj9p148 [Acinetobacter phage Acj9]